MTAPRDTDRRIDAFLGEGPTELPERAYDAVRDQIEHTHQRVVIGPWREPTMSNVMKIAIAAVVIVAVGFGATRLWPTAPDPGVGGGPSPSATTSTSPSASAVSPSSDAPATLTIDTPYAARLEFTATTAWKLWGDIGAAGKGWYKHSVDPPIGLGVTVWKVANAKAEPCGGTYMDPPLGPSVDDLADVLVNQPHTAVLEDSPVTIDGFSGRYLEYTADLSDCSGAIMRRWVTEDTSTRDALDGEHDQVWILDVEGARVVIDAFTFRDTTAADRAELRRVVESVQISAIEVQPSPTVGSPAP